LDRRSGDAEIAYRHDVFNAWLAIACDARGERYALAFHRIVLVSKIGNMEKEVVADVTPNEKCRMSASPPKSGLETAVAACPLWANRRHCA
jgi:hypothetical protein